MDFSKILPRDPIPSLMASNNPILRYFVKRELLGEDPGSIAEIHKLKTVQNLCRKQEQNGSWKSTSASQKKYPAINYSLIETWKKFGLIVEKFGFTKKDRVVQKAAEYIFSCQSEEGDIRGILANQYTTYYTGAILSLLIQAGYLNDSRITKGKNWLMSIRQNDGGWLASPLMSLQIKFSDYSKYTAKDFPTVKEHDKTQPSSHNWTGMVIRAFAVHPQYRLLPEVKIAGNLLKSAFFKQDEHYTSYQSAEYWVKFQFPYWWNNLVAAMDSLSRIGFSTNDSDIQKAINWFTENQLETGLWKLSYGKKQPKKRTDKIREEELWVSYKICQIFKRLFE